ncbi:MAG: hypothetical protein ACMUIL_08205 [bacterium]
MINGDHWIKHKDMLLWDVNNSRGEEQMNVTTRRDISFLCSVFLMFALLLFLLMSLVSFSYAGAYIVGTAAQDYLNAPAVGSNVVGYLVGDYISPSLTHLNLFVKKCECLKRDEYRYDEGVLVTYVQNLSKEEFDSLTPKVLVGMVDTDGQLATALVYGTGLIPVIDRVLEYKKTTNQFTARVSIKFVYMNP